MTGLIFITWISFVIAGGTWLIAYGTEAGRMMHFLHAWPEKFYREATDDYPWWLMWWMCAVCRGFWGALTVAIILRDHPFFWAIPILTHFFILYIKKKIH